MPILVLHGTDDRMAAPRRASTCANSAGSVDKTLVLIPDAYDALLRDLDREQTIMTIIEWMDARRAR